MNKFSSIFAALLLCQPFSKAAELPAVLHPPLLVASYNTKAAYIIAADDKVLWKTELPGFCQDAWLLDDGNVLASGGNIVKVVRPDNSLVWQYTGPVDQQIEIHNCQALPGSGVLFGEGGANRLVELDKDGRQVKEIKLTLKGGAHGQMRQVRKLPDGNYLVCGMCVNILYEFDPSGNQVRLVSGEDMKMQGVYWKALHSADQLPNGNLLVGGGYNSSLAEIDPSGKVGWNLTTNDVPEMGFTFAAGSQRLPDGTTVVAAYHSKVPIFAVSQDKKVLWTCKTKEIGHPTHVKVLSDQQVAPFIAATHKEASKK